MRCTRGNQPVKIACGIVYLPCNGKLTTPNKETFICTDENGKELKDVKLYQCLECGKCYLYNASKRELIPFLLGKGEDIGQYRYQHPPPA